MNDPQVATLLQDAVRRLVDDPAALLARVDAAVMTTNANLLDLDPALADPLRAAARTNVTHWALATLADPTAPVAANLSQEQVDFALAVVRHGFDETILAGFRAAQNVAVAFLQEIAFEASDDPATVKEFLRFATASVFAYVDETLAGLGAIIDAERRQLRGVAHAAQLETVSLLLEGAPISVRRANERLGYHLERTHTAAVLWRAARGPRVRGDVPVEAVARELAASLDVARPLVLPVDPDTVWIWAANDVAPHGPTLRERLARTGGVPDGVLAATGRPASGVAGFRSSHLEALGVQRLVRRLPRPDTFTTYDDVELVALTGTDDTRTRDFVRRTLGDLLDGPAELRETYATWLREGSNATRTAECLFTHRNTVLARLEKARALLPRRSRERPLQVGLALELAQFFGGKG